MPKEPYCLLTGCLGIQFFYLPPFFQHRQLGYICLPTPHCAAIGHQPLPCEAEDFRRGDNHSKHVPLLTFLQSVS